jgi:hypothetical protein
LSIPVYRRPIDASATPRILPGGLSNGAPQRIEQQSPRATRRIDRQPIARGLRPAKLVPTERC